MRKSRCAEGSKEYPLAEREDPGTPTDVIRGSAPGAMRRATRCLLTADHALFALRGVTSSIVRTSSKARGRLSIQPKQRASSATVAASMCLSATRFFQVTTPAPSELACAPASQAWSSLREPTSICR